MKFCKFRSALASISLVAVTLLVSCQSALAIDYDVIAVKAPRYGDETPTTWQEVAYPTAVEPGQDLVLIRKDGTEEVLVSCKSSGCAVVDPVMSLDGKSVYYSFYPDVRYEAINNQRGVPFQGADIYRMELASRVITRLTAQEFTPNTANKWASDATNSKNEKGVFKLGYGVLNLGPCPVPGPTAGSERIVFTSSRNGFMPARGLTNPNLQLFVMDSNGENIHHIGPMNLGSALHPVVLTDGRIIFASSEAQGNRDERLWSIWGIYPDGRNFHSIMSGMTDADAFHFQTQLSNGEIAIVEYYNLNNNGFGTILAFPSTRPPSSPAFGDPDPSHPSNPQVRRGFWLSPRSKRFKQYSFSPIGLRSLTSFAHGEDFAADRLSDGSYAGKVTHPSGAPNNDLLLVWSPGPANDLPRPDTMPRVHGGIYLLRNGLPVEEPSKMVLIKGDPTANYQQPRAVVPYGAIYGVTAPQYIPYVPDGTTPFGIVGTASFYNRNSRPGLGVASYDGLDPFNTGENYATSNWALQGADAGLYSNSDIFAVRILAMEPSSHLSYGADGEGHWKGFSSFAGERLRILGEIPLRKFVGDSQPKDGDGNPDTSFLARIPADVPFTFQTIDRNGLVLNMSQTWHQLRPGEKRFDCGGCHAHANLPTDFSKTAAARPDYAPWDLVDNLTLLTKAPDGLTNFATFKGAERKRRMDVEYLRDIKPIFERSCVGCHTSKGGVTPAAQMDLADSTIVERFEKTYRCLTMDQDGKCGFKPVIGSWRHTNASRWIRKFQSRRSLLVWKVFGRRLDGWKNEDHPTESIPGNAQTLPPGAHPNDADLDFSGTIMPPPGSGYPPLSEDEKMTIARWIDLGAPSDKNVDGAVSGWFFDDLRPALHVVVPRGEEMQSLSRIEFVAHDYYGGLDADATTVKADFSVAGVAPGDELRDLFAPVGDGVWRLTLPEPLSSLSKGRIVFQVSDQHGNRTREIVSFSVGPNGSVEPPQGSGSPTIVPTRVATPSTSRTPQLAALTKVTTRVGAQFRYTIAATNVGKDFGPVKYSFKGLPTALSKSSGRIVRGVFSRAGVYQFKLTVKNRFGVSNRGIVRVSVRDKRRK